MLKKLEIGDTATPRYAVLSRQTKDYDTREHHSVLFTNPAGLIQSKTPKEFQGTNAASLAWDDELLHHEELLHNSNGLLTDYEYQRLQWSKNHSTGFCEALKTTAPASVRL